MKKFRGTCNETLFNWTIYQLVTQAAPTSVQAAVRSASGAAGELHPVAAEEHVVVIRGDVLDTVGHVLGNLFQRLYHLVDRVSESDGLTADELRGNAGRLENVLQLFLDYVSPVAPSLQAVAFLDVAQSLSQRFNEASGGRLRVQLSVPASGSVLVDPGRLARAFDLLAARVQLRPGLEAVEPIRVELNATPRWLEVRVGLLPDYVAARSSEVELRWALAEKLIDLHGGTLTDLTQAAGEMQWLITLPLQP